MTSTDSFQAFPFEEEDPDADRFLVKVFRGKWKLLSKSGLLHIIFAIARKEEDPISGMDMMDAIYAAVRARPAVRGVVDVRGMPDEIIDLGGTRGRYINVGAGLPNPFDDGSPKEVQICREFLSLLKPITRRSDYWWCH